MACNVKINMNAVLSDEISRYVVCWGKPEFAFEKLEYIGRPECLSCFRSFINFSANLRNKHFRKYNIKTRRIRLYLYKVIGCYNRANTQPNYSY